MLPQTDRSGCSRRPVPALLLSPARTVPIANELAIVLVFANQAAHGKPINVGNTRALHSTLPVANEKVIVPDFADQAPNCVDSVIWLSVPDAP